MENKGIKKYKVEHYMHDYYVTIEINWDKKPPYDYKSMQAMIKAMAESIGGCPDVGSEELTEAQLDCFLKIAATTIIRLLAEYQRLDTPDNCHNFLLEDERFVPFGVEHGIRVVDVEGIEIPDSDEFNIEILGE